MHANQQKTWAVILDSNACRIYDYDKPSQLNLKTEIEHPENKLRDIDLTSDKPGRYMSKGTAQGSYTQESDPKEVKIESFSREVAKMLEHGRNTNAYDKLIIVALPHMTGLLLQHLNKHVEERISHKIEKDLMHLKPNDLLHYLNDATGLK